MTAVRLLALDIDGTLLTDDGDVAPADRLAIERARAEGVHVTLATGRLPSAALPVAEELGLGLPLVCCDGAVTVCPHTHVDLHSAGLDPGRLEAALGLFLRHQVTSFLFTPGGVVARAADGEAPYVSGWSSRLIVEPSLTGFARAPNGAAVLAALGIATEARARAAHDELSALPIPGVHAALFLLEGTDRWAVRVSPVGVDKASGLARLAAELGIEAADVAVVGDWHNDVPMFAWAGHSFAMGHAPREVARAARHRLRATAARGGGVAEAIARLSELGVVPDRVRAPADRARAVTRA
jgi:Cof subfamily protein (haloacid dehalogenase superfamily)